MSHIKSADVYYRSSSVSALRANGEACPTSSAPPPASPTTQVRSSDKYYRHASPLPAQGVTHTRVAHAQSTHPLSVGADASITATVNEILARLDAGQETVHVEIADRGVITKSRTQLDLAVAREKLTEERYRDIKFVGVSQFAPPGVPPAESSSVELKGEALASSLAETSGIEVATSSEEETPQTLETSAVAELGVEGNVVELAETTSSEDVEDDDAEDDDSAV